MATVGGLRSEWWRGWFVPSSGLRPRPADVAVAAAVAVAQVVGTLAYSQDEPTRWDLDAWAVALLVVGPVALLFRLRWPEATLAVTFVAAAAYAAGGWPRGPVGFPALGLALASAIVMGRRAFAWTVLALSYPAFVGLPSLVPDEAEVTRTLAGRAVNLTAWLPLVAACAELVRISLERRTERARARQEEARRRAGQERLVIARELHDVLAHTISLINVQSGVALHLLDDQPEHARPALAAINEASEEALRGLRSVLDILHRDTPPTPGPPAGRLPSGSRASGSAGSTTAGAAAVPGTSTPDGWTPQVPTAGPSDLETATATAKSKGVVGGESRVGTAEVAVEPSSDGARSVDESVRHGSTAAAFPGARTPDTWAPRAPTAGLGDLDGLLRRVGTAGLEVDLVVDGDVSSLPAAVDLAAFRIVQESLTNVVRHASEHARATVHIERRPADLVVHVDDDGGQQGMVVPDHSTRGSLGGRGITGMRERVHALGGTFAAGPRPGGGFGVDARFPFRPARVRAGLVVAVERVGEGEWA